MSDHSGLPAIPVHGQVYKVHLSYGQIDLESNVFLLAVKMSAYLVGQPDELTGQGKDGAHHVASGEHKEHRGHPEGVG